jgi:hypothetical protein
LRETFVLQKLRRQASWRPDPIEFFHYYDRDDFKVDVVLEFGSTAVAGVEVKAEPPSSNRISADYESSGKPRNGSDREWCSTTARQV